MDYKKIKEEFESRFSVPDFLIFDGEDYMYYEEDPVLEEQCRNTTAQWRGFSFAARIKQKEITDLTAELKKYKPESPLKELIEINTIKSLTPEQLNYVFTDLHKQLMEKDKKIKGMINDIETIIETDTPYDLVYKLLDNWKHPT